MTISLKYGIIFRKNSSTPFLLSVSVETDVLVNLLVEFLHLPLVVLVGACQKLVLCIPKIPLELRPRKVVPVHKVALLGAFAKSAIPHIRILSLHIDGLPRLFGCRLLHPLLCESLLVYGCVCSQPLTTRFSPTSVTSHTRLVMPSRRNELLTISS